MKSNLILLKIKDFVFVKRILIVVIVNFIRFNSALKHSEAK